VFTYKGFKKKNCGRMKSGFLCGGLIASDWLSVSKVAVNGEKWRGFALLC
jgi:hypothetical protein